MKRVRYVDGSLDALDMKILNALAQDARTPMRELAQKIGLSAPSTTEPGGRAAGGDSRNHLLRPRHRG
jgi:AsnC-type helix-turn-helix domain